MNNADLLTLPEGTILRFRKYFDEHVYGHLEIEHKDYHGEPYVNYHFRVIAIDYGPKVGHVSWTHRGTNKNDGWIIGDCERYEVVTPMEWVLFKFEREP